MIEYEGGIVRAAESMTRGAMDWLLHERIPHVRNAMFALLPRRSRHAGSQLTSSGQTREDRRSTDDAEEGLYDVMLRDSRGGQFKGLGQPIVLRVRACIVTVSGRCRYSFRLVKLHCHPFPHTLTPSHPYFSKDSPHSPPESPSTPASLPPHSPTPSPPPTSDPKTPRYP